MDLPKSLIRDLANAAMGKPDILPFWFGESDQPTPGYIRAAAIQSLQDGETRYTQNLGRPYLITALSDYLTRLHQRPVAEGRITTVSAGISGLMLAAQAIISPGDRVVGISPLWPNVLQIPAILAADVTRVPLEVRHGKWDLDLDALLSALTPDTRVLILNSPSNPTGWMISPRQIEAILAHCRRYGIWIISDDVYQRLAYNPELNCAPSFLDYAEPEDRVISVNSFSKAWLMTGFRVGWMVAPEGLINELTKLIEYNTCCIFEPAQRAAQTALLRGESTIRDLRAHLRGTRPLLVKGLRSMPNVEVPEAGGGMYVFFRIHGQEDTTAFARRLLAKTGVGLAPGAAFGEEGQGWLRWCHAAEAQKITEALERMQRFMTMISD